MGEQTPITPPTVATPDNETATVEVVDRPNPYVGPRTFTAQQAHLFFGREREARELLALVIAERLVLFYAQSGAGKSSLLQTRLIPQLQEKAHYLTLPVGRVGGELPAGVTQVANIYLFNLYLKLNQASDDLARFANMNLTEFMSGLRTPDGEHYFYDPAVAQRAAARQASGQLPSPQPPHVLIIDQFEELITAHPTRWAEREDFFRQLNDAMQNDPYLWVVLTLREDFVAALDPYAQLVPGNMRTRYYMQRMGVEAAQDAVQNPAAQAGRQFAPGVAAALVDNLRRIKVVDQHSSPLGQYIEPVQLQVVCYQLWENLKNRPLGPITHADLQQAGDVDTALATFYESALTNVLQQPGVNVSERQLRTWFNEQLITEAGTRGTVYQGGQETAGLPNEIVQLLANQFLLRTELRAGGAWIELVHDRFVEPIVQANRQWFSRYQSPLTQAAEVWRAADKAAAKLYRGDQLKEAQRQLETTPADFDDLEREFVAASQTFEQLRATRRQQLLMITASLLVALFAGLMIWAIFNASRATAETVRANAEASKARAAEATANALRQKAAEQADIAIGEKGKAEIDRQKALEARASADQQNRLARANQLAAASLTSLELDSNVPRSRLLAVEAISTTWFIDKIRTPAAEEALRQALQPSNEPFSVTATSGRLSAISFAADQINSLNVWLGPGGLEQLPVWWSRLLPRSILTPSNSVTDLQLSADGRWGALLTADQQFQLWAIDAETPISLTVPFTSQPAEMAFSANGQWLTTVNVTGTLAIWKLSETGVQTAGQKNAGLLPTAIAISDDGQWLAAASSSNFIRLWDLRKSDDPAILYGHEQTVLALTFSHSGQWLISTSADHTARLWNTGATRDDPLVLRGHQGAVTAANVSPDDGQLATGDIDGIIRLWNMANLQENPITLRAHQAAIRAIVFSRDGRWFATASDDHAVLSWHRQIDELLDLACQSTQRNLTLKEWEQYISNGPYRETCANLPQPSIRDIYNNRQVIGAFLTAARELNQNGWQLLAKAGLSDLLFHVDARYASPEVQALPNLTLAEREVIMRALLGVKPVESTPTNPNDNGQVKLTNQQVINAVTLAAQSLNRDVVELADRAGLALQNLTLSRSAAYSGPDIYHLPNLTPQEQAELEQQLSATQQNQPITDAPLWSRADLLNIPLQVPDSEKIVAPKDADITTVMMATLWNNYGSLITAEAQALQIDPAIALAIVAVEAAGARTGPDGRIIIRFENHIFYQQWGKAHEAEFRQHFAFNPDQTWKDHQWRPSPDVAWRPVHGDQKTEWEVFEFARTLDEVAAMRSISMGSAQLMGFNYQMLGYLSVFDMFAILAAPGLGEHTNILALFDFIAVNNVQSALQAGDFRTFARVYNGAGQADIYTQLMTRASEAFKKLRPSSASQIGSTTENILVTPTATPTPTITVEPTATAPERQATQTVVAPSVISLTKPFQGNYLITQKFGENPEFYAQITYDGVPLKGNPGLDFALPLGTEVLATDAGTVKSVADQPEDAGHYVVLAHSWGESYYFHLDQVKVQTGQMVQRGEIIALSGNSGRAAGPFLHFAIRINPYVRSDGWGGFRDPLPYLKLGQ